MKIKKVLYITTNNIIGNCNFGGAKCALRNYELIQEYFGVENVHLCIFSNEKIGSNIENLKQFQRPKNNLEAFFAAIFNCKTYLPYKEKSIIEYINKLKVDMIFFEGTLFGRIIKKANKAYTMVFLQNIELFYAKNKIKHEGLRYIPSYLASRYNERLMLNNADKVICLNERDSNLVRGIYSVDSDLLLPISFTDNFDIHKIKTNYEKKLLFVGSCFGPNYDGILWFIENVMCDLKEYTLIIVGKDFETRKELERDNVEVIGTVENLEDYYYSFPVLVMPIMYGDGMKVKTAEAMMYGRTILASDEALEGYSVEGVNGIYRCNTAKGYIEQINLCFSQGALQGYNKQVRDLFLLKYETKELKKRVFSLFDDYIEQ